MLWELASEGCAAADIKPKPAYTQRHKRVVCLSDKDKTYLKSVDWSYSL